MVAGGNLLCHHHRPSATPPTNSAQQVLFAIGGALGPAIAGVLLETADGYTPIVLLTTAGFLAAATIIATGARPQRHDP
jgi:predicted MFS family arabinose efflux permease